MEAGNPPASAAISNAAYSGSSSQSTLGFPYGAITLYGPPFQAVRVAEGGLHVATACNPTSRTGYPARFSLGYAAFGRPYSRHPVWFLFLRLLRCFTSAGSRPFRGDRGFTPVRRSHSGIPGSTGACPSPGLIAACRALRRRPSRAIHRPPSLPGGASLPLGVPLLRALIA